MDEYERVLKKVLKAVTPTDADKKRMEELANRTLKLAKQEAERYQAKAMLAGSITRNTWLPWKMEFDVFILFPETMSEKEMEENGLKIGKSVIKKLKGKSVVEYAEHPYVSGSVRGVDIDIVPCYEIASPERLKSAVDRTPFHVKYIESHLQADAADDVRLFKQLCRANGIYGADARTEGLSGYVCELLMIKYGNFVDLLKAVTKWKPGEVIDIEKHYERGYWKLRKKFKQQVLILIDPIDKNRNAAAAFSAKSFYKLKKVAKAFLEKPSVKLFEERKYKPITENELIIKQMQRRTEVILVKFTPPKVVPDILWPQLRKFAARLESILEENEFHVLRRDVYTNESDLAVVLLEMEVAKLPNVQKRVGPLVFDADDSKRFLEKYKPIALSGPFIERNFWVVEIRRRFLTAREKLLDSLQKPLKILKAKGIPNYIAEQVAKRFEIILETEKIMKLVKKDENFGVFLRRYFEKESLV